MFVGVRRFARACRTDLLGALVFICVTSWPLLDPRRIFAALDTVTYTAPNHAISFEAIRAGGLASWNPYIFGGAPHLANAAVGFFYPPKVPFLWAEPHRGIGLLILFHLALMAVGMIVLVGGVLEFRTPAPLIGAMAFVGSGFVLLQMVNVEVLLTIAWSPWLIAAVDVTATGRVSRRRGIALIALASALMLLAGHQQPAYYILGLATVWTVGRAIQRRCAAPLALVPIGVLIGAGIAAVQLVPTALVVGRSLRSRGFSLAELAVPVWSLDLRELPARLLGDVFARSVVVEPGIGAIVYVGAAVATLALLGLVSGIRRGSLRPLLGAVALATAGAALLAAGPRTALLGFVYRIVPGLGLFRAPARWVVVVALGLAILAAVGADAVFRRRLNRSDVLVASGLGLALALAIAPGPLNVPSGRTLLLWLVASAMVAVAALAIRRPALSLLASIALIAVPAIELGLLARSSPSWVLPDQARAIATVESTVRNLQTRSDRGLVLAADKTLDFRYALNTLRPNVNSRLHIRSLDGYDGGPSVTLRWADAMESLTGRPFDVRTTLRQQIRPPLDPRLLARFGVGWVLIDTTAVSTKTFLPAWEGPSFRSGSLEVWGNPAYEEDASLYMRTRPPGNDIGRSLRALGTDLNSVALVEGERHLRCRSVCERVPVSVVRKGPEHLTLRTSAEKRSLLVLTEQWDPGWRARVDGEPARIVHVDGFLMGVSLSGGRHTVELVHVPEGLQAGAAISIVCLLIVTVLAVRRAAGPRLDQGVGHESRAA